MRSEESRSAGHKNRSDAAPKEDKQCHDINPSDAVAQPGVQLPGIHQLLDDLRRTASTDRWKLFRRAAPSDEYLIKLSEAGVLKTRGFPETSCRLIDGEAICDNNGEPRTLDCRQAWCPYAALMRMRLIVRLRAAYARERRRLVEQS